MKKSLLLLVLSSFLAVTSYAQDKGNFGIKFSGFVKTDVFWDSRQTVSLREGHFLLYPANEKLDADGEDINAKPNFNILSIQTRLRGTITGPDALGAKTSGVIEGAFFGHTEGDINGFRLRHAFVKLDWKNTSLLAGQYWHPAFVTYCFPGVVSFNTGTPFVPFTRNPQVRLTQKLGNVNLMLTVLSQLDFTSFGPNPSYDKNDPSSPANIMSPRFHRNSAIPAVNFRYEYRKVEEENGREFVIGASTNYKMLTPRLVTDKGYKTSNTINSFAETFYFKMKFPAITFKLQGIYAQDAFNWVMIGGYAVENISDTLKDMRDYIPISTASGWIDIHTNGKQMQFGLLAGYSKNLGAGSDFEGPTYQRGGNIDYVYRISPRFIYNAGRFRIAPEIEYTVAAYATADDNGDLNIDSKGKVTDSKEVGNFRFLLGVYLFF